MGAHSFTIITSPRRQNTPLVRESSTLKAAMSADACKDRRSVLRSVFGVVASSVSLPHSAWAEEANVGDDLSMPDAPPPLTPEQEAAFQEERLAKKAALQKKSARPLDYKESIEGEKEKQKELKKSGVERRNAMCEELGRGC